MKFILGEKIGMTRMFDASGNVVPVTVLRAGPVVVTQVKSVEKDGYKSVQVGYGRKKNLAKPQRGHLKGKGNLSWLKEFKTEDSSEFSEGKRIDVSVFVPGDKVNIQGISKGKGFAGVVKRHGFRGGWASHGNKHMLRAPGSIGMSWPERVPKGRKMAGRMGYDKVTVKNLEVIEVDSKNNTLALRGAVPGNKGSWIVVVKK